jgi:hypothetical protein
MDTTTNRAGRAPPSSGLLGAVVALLAFLVGSDHDGPPTSARVEPAGTLKPPLTLPSRA